MKSNQPQWVATTPARPWQTQTVPTPTPQAGPGDDVLTVSTDARQTITGFGGCFNELGMVALNRLPEARKAEVFDALFHPDHGAGFAFCRLPMGASDFATRWYSYNETEGDLAMDHFSIDPDRPLLLPYIREAQRRRPDLRFFASPWSPPTWMKFPAVYNYGRLRMEPAVLEAYARYFALYVKAYRVEGIRVDQVHVQNEPFADQKFPSCLWSAEQLKVFIGKYLGPEFERQGLGTEIWFGTLNGPEIMKFGPQITLDPYHEYVEDVLLDHQARKYIRGVGYQWAGRQNIARTRASFPELGLMQTENECGSGDNSWEYAFYVFTLMHHYLGNGANAYTYWNMVLDRGGVSTWGWSQNSLVCVGPDGTVDYNPEFYVMKHLAKFVVPGARVLTVSGVWSSSALAFRNPDGSLVVVACNFLDRERTLVVREGGQDWTYRLAARSLNTLVL